MASSAVMRGWSSVLLLAACERVEPGTVRVAGPTAVAEATAGAGSIVGGATPGVELAAQTGRACGEAGAVATELPSGVAAGRTAVGSGTLTPDSARQVGGVALRYEASAWHGTMRAGQRGPGLHVEIDRAEVGPHAPWGTLAELHPETTTTLTVGPYHVALAVSAGSPPAEVTATVTREVCPAAAVIERAATPRWLWLSSEGIRLHTHDPTGAPLQVSLLSGWPEPRALLTYLGYRHWFEPRPGAARRLQAGDYEVSFDRVLAGPETRFEGRWVAAAEARLHVRGRIEATTPTSFPAATPATTPCGDPSAVRMTLPTPLGAPLAIAETRHLRAGEKLQLGPIALEFGQLEVPARGQGPYREEGYVVANLQVLGPRGGTSMSGPFTTPRMYRIEQALLRVTGEGAAVRVDRVALACASELAIAAVNEPVYVWLGVSGRTHVRVGEFDVRALHLQVYPESPASLALSSERGSLTRELGPGLVGQGFTLDEHLVEVVELRVGAAGPDGLPPATHVQLRVTPRA